MDTDAFIHIMRREAQSIYQSYMLPTTFGSVTSYNPAIHAVKVVLQPTGIESGWIPLATPHATGSGGIAAGPKVGSAEAMDGDQVIVQFIGNDPDTPVATHRLYDSANPPPLVQSTELVMQHTGGTKVLLDQDGALTASRPDGTMVKLTKDGDIISNPAPGRTAYHGGDPSDGKSTFAFIMTTAGPSSNVKAKIG